MKKIVVIIPTLNEEKNISSIVNGVLRQKKKLEKFQVSILVVDSDSIDTTREKVLSLRKKNKHIYLLHLIEKGLGIAISKGMQYAFTVLKADYIATLDSDGSHDPKELASMISELNISDLVIGSRYQDQGQISNWPLHRRLLSLFGNYYLQTFLGLKNTTDYTSNYRVMKRKVIKEVIFSSNSLPDDWSFLCVFLLEAARKKFILSEHPIIFSDRKFGVSKLDSFQYSQNLLILPWQYRFRTIFATINSRFNLENLFSFGE